MAPSDHNCAPQPLEISLSPEVTLTLLTDGDRLLGLGEVTVAGVPLRSGAVPLRPDFSTLDAVHYQDFLLQSVDTAPDGAVTVRTTALGRPEVFSNDLMDEYDWTLTSLQVRGVQQDRLDWIFTPQELTLDGERYVGFSLGFRFSSEKNKIHRLMTLGTWEIGGRATGNTLYFQSQVGPPVYEAELDTHYTSACLQRLDLWHSPAGNSYQLCPRWGSAQPFDFLAAQEGVLLGYWQDPHSAKCLLQKNPGEEVLFVLDEYDFPLAAEVTIPAKHVLFSPAPPEGRAPHEIVNMWTRALEHTGDIIRGFFGIKNCYPIPSGSVPVFAGKNSCSIAESREGPRPDWGWRIEGNKFYLKLLDGENVEEVESHDYLHWTADHILPRLAAAGVHRTALDHPIHESDFSELAFLCHAQIGWHSDIYCSSVCGTHRYQPAAFWGGWEGWNYYRDRARAYGIMTGHWVGLHLTPRAAIVQEHPEYLIRHANTKNFGGGYGHQCICSINWCTGAKQWFLDDLRRWHDEGGLEWIFFDSWPNLACLSANYGGNCEPMQWEMGDVLHQLQEIGYKWFSFEGTSPFGVHQYGLSDPLQDYEGHVLQGVAGQNDFGKLIGHEYMAYNTQFLGPEINPGRGEVPRREWSFRYMANRSLTLVSDEDALTYEALLPCLEKRYLLPDDQGVRWESPAGQALFAYQSFAYAVPPGKRAVKLVAGHPTPVDAPNGVLQTEPWTAYGIG